VRRRHSTGEIRFIIDRFQTVNSIPSGNRMPALSDSVVLTCTFRGTPQIEHVPEIVQAARSQLWVFLMLDHEQRNRLQVVIWDRGQLLPADCVKISGSGGFEVPEPPAEDPFDMTPERRLFLEHRDSRTVGGLGASMISKVRRMCLSNVGAGGGGSSLAIQLASFKPRRMMLFDTDTMDPVNLNAMPHASELDAMQQVLKVEALAAAIEANQPDIHVNGLPWSITEGRAIRLLEKTRVDAFFSFVDNNTARLCTSYMATEAHVVHIDVGTRIRWQGDQRIMRADIRLFEPGQGQGCVLCVPELPAAERENAFYELNAPAGSMHRGEPFDWNDPVHGRAGSLLLLNTVAASMAVDLWLAWLDGRIATSHWLRVNWTFGQPMQTESFSVTGVPGCRFCGRE